jgi:hypothetical protein
MSAQSFQKYLKIWVSRPQDSPEPYNIDGLNPFKRMSFQVRGFISARLKLANVLKSRNEKI